ncbi:FLNA [Mytilus edulis]|uniref:FLNA n=1 Tax=Mytilus edulis TaxID=6550 RepID=A0A8S3QIN1_MYTED|nr:FLNA [Mytilus edulis]
MGDLRTVTDENLCKECDCDKPVEWVCLECNEPVHDFCIAAHINRQASLTHSVIPNFDALTQGRVLGSKTVTKPRVDKIIVCGPGIESIGLVGEFDSTFNIDTYGAGHGHLNIQIVGPKGAFEVKMAPHSERKTTIMCSYEAKDVGEYTITVTWSGLEVPGSPFKVVLTDQIDSSL